MRQTAIDNVEDYINALTRHGFEDQSLEYKIIEKVGLKIVNKNGKKTHSYKIQLQIR